MNTWLTTENPSFENLTDFFVSKIRESSDIKRFRSPLYEIAVRAILVNLAACYFSSNKRYLTFSMNKKAYSVNDRYHPKMLAHGPTMRAVDVMHDLGYVEHIKGFYYRVGDPRNRQARLRATAKLAELIKSYKLSSAMIRNETTYECLILKGRKSEGKKEKIDYTDTPESNLIHEKLRKINANIQKQWVDIKITDSQFYDLRDKLNNSGCEGNSPIDFTRTTLSRIFNNGDTKNPKFNQGGRFYHGWWMEIPKEYRSFITINGKKTIELDYSAMHFYMMYAEKGLDIPEDDLYVLDGLERNDCKKALNIAINSSSKTKATTSISESVWTDKSREEVESLLDKLLCKHKLIDEFFFTGKGVHLQFKDSCIAESIMIRAWDEYEVLVLPVHDSFIIPAGFRDVLNVLMIDCFKAELGSIPKMEPKEKDEALMTEFQLLSRVTEYDDAGNITKAGVNGKDTFAAYQHEQTAYIGYNIRKAEWYSEWNSNELSSG